MILRLHSASLRFARDDGGGGRLVSAGNLQFAIFRRRMQYRVRSPGARHAHPHRSERQRVYDVDTPERMKEPRTAPAGSLDDTRSREDCALHKPKNRPNKPRNRPFPPGFRRRCLNRTPPAAPPSPPVALSPPRPWRGVPGSPPPPLSGPWRRSPGWRVSSRFWRCRRRGRRFPWVRRAFSVGRSMRPAMVRARVMGADDDRDRAFRHRVGVGDGPRCGGFGRSGWRWRRGRGAGPGPLR